MKKDIKKLLSQNQKIVFLFLGLLLAMAISLSIFSCFYHPEKITISWLQLTFDQLTDGKKILLCAKRANGGYFIISPTVHSIDSEPTFAVSKNLNLIQENEKGAYTLTIKKEQNDFDFSFQKDSQTFYIAAGSSKGEVEARIFTDSTPYGWTVNATDENNEFIVTDSQNRTLTFLPDYEKWMAYDNVTSEGATRILFFGEN